MGGRRNWSHNDLSLRELAGRIPSYLAVMHSSRGKKPGSVSQDSRTNSGMAWTMYVHYTCASSSMVVPSCIGMAVVVQH